MHLTFSWVTHTQAFCLFDDYELTVMIYSVKWNSAPMISHGLPGISWLMIFSLGCICWNARHVEQIFTVFSISAFILIQWIDLDVSSFLFWYPSVCFCNSPDIMMHLPFSNIPSITTRSSLNVQNGLSSGGISFLCHSQCHMISFRLIWWISSCNCTPPFFLSVALCTDHSFYHSDLFLAHIFAYIFHGCTSSKLGIWHTYAIWGAHMLMRQSMGHTCVMWQAYMCSGAYASHV